MNREIKFRVWNGNYKLMREVFGMDLKIGRAFLDENMMSWWMFKHCTLLQYTNFNDDSEGTNDIYDGHIILGSWYEPSDEYGGQECTDIAKVFLDETSGQWMVKEFKTTGETYPLYDYCEKVEIIGNIYENKELLE